MCNLLNSILIKLRLMITISVIMNCFAMMPSYAQNQGSSSSSSSSSSQTCPVTSYTTAIGTQSCNSVLTCGEAVANNTYYALQLLNSIPCFILNWTSPDTSSTNQNMPTSIIFPAFTTLGAALSNEATYQASTQAQIPIMNSILGLPTGSLTPSSGTSVPPILSKQYASLAINDISYTTVLNTPIFPNFNYSQNTSQQNYLNYAAGLMFPHTMPNPIWTGNPTDVTRYTQYFNTVAAIESFNGYALNGLYADYNNGGAINNTITSLVQQVTGNPPNSSSGNGTTWAAQVSGQTIGWVLRQTLMFISQSYVLQAQMYQLQRQMLTAQVMTNSLLILNNASNETTMLNKAQNIGPRSH